MHYILYGLEAIKVLIAFVFLFSLIIMRGAMKNPICTIFKLKKTFVDDIIESFNMHDSWDLFCGGTGYNHTFDDIEFTATDSNNNQYVYSLLFNKQIGDFKLDNQGFRRDLVSGYDDYIFMNKTISKALISYYKKKGIEIIKVTGDTVTYKSAKFNNFKAGPTKRVLIFDIRKKVI